MEVNLNIIMLARDARNYYDAYNVLTEMGMDLSSPALVCLAFSTELHLKLLLRTYDKGAKVHDISKLIKLLPPEEITLLSTDPYFHPTQQGEHFFENTTKAAHLFIRTRYYFEDMGTLHFNTGFCDTLCKVIRKRIAIRIPYLTGDLGAFSK